MNQQPSHVVHVGFDSKQERLLRTGHQLTVLLDDDSAAALPAGIRDRFARIGALHVPPQADLGNYDTAFEQMTAYVDKFATELGPPVAVVGLSEESVLPAARLREYLALPGMSPRTALLLRDKVRMKEAVRAAGVDVPRFWPVGPDTTAEDAARLASLTPDGIVLKPRSQAAAMGVSIFRDPAAFIAHVRDEGVGADHEAEEFLAGDLCHVDGLIRAGRMLFLSAATYLAPPYDVVTEGGHPLGSVSVDDPALLAAMEDLATTVLAAVGLDDGVFHLELFVRPDGRLTFLEVAGRPGGGGIAEHIHRVHGIDLAEEALRVCLGERPRYDGPRTILDGDIPASGWLWVTTPAGGDRKVERVRGSDRLPGSVVHSVVPSVGDTFTGAAELYRSAGMFTFVGESARSVTADAHEVWSGFSVEYGPL